MFSLMGNCISCIQKKQGAKRPLTIAILGLDNAGKTTTTKGFIGGPIDLDIAPTVGFSYEKFPFDKYDITLYDLGGGKKIRGIWKNYLHEIYGLIYVVDSSAADRIEEAHDNLKQLLQNPHISGKPLLLLANKQDKKDALHEVDICEQLDLDNIATTNKCHCRLETCSAIRGAGKKMDKNIKNGMIWMMSAIEKQFDVLKSRIDNDLKEEEEKRKIDQQDRKKRVEERRKEREQEEEAERNRLGMEERGHDEEETMNGNPFKKLDVNDLKKRDQKLKEEKRQKKELLLKFEEEEKEDAGQVEEEFKTPRNVRSLSSLPSVPLGASNLQQTNIFSSPSANPLLPPLQTPLGTKFVDEPAKRKKKKKSKLCDEEQQLGADNFSESVGMKSMRSISKIEVMEKHLDSSRSQKSHDSNFSTSRLGELQDDGSEGSQPIKNVKKKKKKKPSYVVLSDSEENDTEKENNSRPRKVPPSPYIQVVPPSPFMQVVPPSISENFEDDVTPPSSHRRKKKNRFLKKRAGTSDDDITPKHSGRQNNSVQSVREYMRSPRIKETGDSDDENKGQVRQTGIVSSNKWNLIDDLPEVCEEPRRLKANLNDELL